MILDGSRLDPGCSNAPPRHGRPGHAGSLVVVRPTLAAAHDANAVVADTVAHAASYGTAGSRSANVNVKVRST